MSHNHNFHNLNFITLLKITLLLLTWSLLPSIGELIGLQYLFRQTGRALQDMHPDSEETAQLVEEHEVEEEEVDEGFSDLAADPTLHPLEVEDASEPPSTFVDVTSSVGASTTSPGTLTSIQ